MAQFSFILKEPRATEPTIIFFIVRHGEKRIKYSTGEKILPAQWDKATGRPKTNTKAAKSILSQLERYIDTYRKYLNFLDGTEGNFCFDELREKLDDKFKANPTPKPLAQNSLIQFAESLIETTDKKVMTKRNYRTALNKLKEFEAITRKPLTFEKIDLDFYFSIIDFLKAQNLALNSIGSIIKNIKVFMDLAFEKGLHTNLAYKSKRFKVIEEETTQIYLTESELQKIYELDLTDTPRLETVRDYFIIGCRTGLRFSDLHSLRKENIIEGASGNYFKIRTTKTGETVFIPLHGQTLQILEKYDYQLPRLISNQKFNEYIKEIASKAELKTKVTTHRTEGGHSVERTKQKLQLVTVHTARRTFATLAYKAGLPAQSIMKITGHRTEKAFQKYIKLSNEEHAELMAKHEFFSPLRIAK